MMDMVGICYKRASFTIQTTVNANQITELHTETSSERKKERKKHKTKRSDLINSLCPEHFKRLTNHSPKIALCLSLYFFSFVSYCQWRYWPPFSVCLIFHPSRNVCKWRKRARELAVHHFSNDLNVNLRFNESHTGRWSRAFATQFS